MFRFLSSEKKTDLKLVIETDLQIQVVVNNKTLFEI